MKFRTKLILTHTRQTQLPRLLLEILGVFLAGFSLSAKTTAQPAVTNLVVIDSSKTSDVQPIPNPHLGGKSASGHEIGVTSQYLTFDGQPWLPVMGEFHYARYPEQYWEDELLKMKAGGVQIVSTYLFWNHHEEIEGEFDWSGQRDLRRFVELCAKHGLYVFLRIGPWSHGEVRNGGFPDWLLTKGPTRRNDPRYLSYVRRYFGQISQQVRGLLWKDGGPIVGVQFENEYYEHGPDAGAAHIAELKKIAGECGIEAPLYTITGWGNPDFPAGEVIPVFGGYPDDFWESSLTDSPPSGYYLFESARDNGEMGPASQRQTRFEYPYFMAEGGGGMEVAYHRRPVIYGDDVPAIALTRIGSGANLYGYYLFHGGSNPAGKLTTLQESIATDHVYDLPTVSYDFQAPLGEFGEMNDSFRAIKTLHLFLQVFGGDVATMRPVLREGAPTAAKDSSSLRAAARVRGDRAFLFVNNYQRTYPLPDQHNVRFQLKLSSQTFVLPRNPIDVPSGDYFIWPVNLKLAEATLRYATAQPLAAVDDGSAKFYFFAASPGIAPEFAFDGKTVRSVRADRAMITRHDGVVYVSRIKPGTNIALTLQSKAGKTVRIIVLSESQALNIWKDNEAGTTRLLLSPADMFFDSTRVHLRARDVSKLRFSVFPAPASGPTANAPLRDAGHDGIFTTYAATVTPKQVPVRWEKARDESPSVPVKMDKYNAAAPGDQDFDRAGTWRLVLPANALQELSDLFLQIDYQGDVARLYAGSQLLADDFYKGTPWEIGSKRFAMKSFGQEMEIRIMPLRKDSPIYMPKASWPKFPANREIADIRGITAIPEYEIRVEFAPARTDREGRSR